LAFNRECKKLLKIPWNCQNSRVIKLGVGLNQKNLLQLLGQMICKTFVFLIYFVQMGPSVFLKNKNVFQKVLFKAIYNSKIMFVAQTMSLKIINYNFLCYEKSICLPLTFVNLVTVLARTCIPHWRHQLYYPWPSYKKNSAFNWIKRKFLIK